VEEAAAASLPRGASVYITALPGDDADAVVGAAARLRRAGLNPVPHLGARYLASEQVLDALLRRLTAEAGVSQVLVIGGDTDHVSGPFASSLDLLRAGALSRHGIRRIGLAGYPEPHPRIAAAVLDAALADKISHAQKDGAEVYVVTQFCFSPDPIRTWVLRFARRFPGVPVQVGLAGPAHIATLLKYGLACGIGPSLRALRRNPSLGRLAAEASPAPIIEALAQDPTLAPHVSQFHFFTFGGVRRTAAWIRDFASHHRTVQA